jgi:hypothetical protein
MVQNSSKKMRVSGKFGVELRFVVISLTLIMWPILLLADWDVEGLALAQIPVLLVLVGSAIKLAWLSVLKVSQPVTTTFWVFNYFFLGFVPFLQLATNRFPRSNPFGDQIYLKGALLVLVGIISFEVGYSVRFKSKKVVRTLILKSLGNQFSARDLVKVSVVFLPLCLFSVMKVGGLDVFFVPRSEQYQLISSNLENPQHLLFEGLAALPVFIILVAGILRAQFFKSIGGNVFGPYLVLSILGIWVLVLNNPISTPRFQVGAIVLGLWFVYSRGRVLNGVTIFGLIGGLTVVFPVLGFFRHNLGHGVLNKIQSFSVTESLVESADFSAFQVVSTIISVTDQVGHQMGQQIAGAFLFWVPRSLWEGKPISTSFWASGHIGYPNQEISAPLWSEFYVDGGVFLLVGGFVLYGFFVRSLDSVYQSSRRNAGPRAVDIFVPVYAGIQIFVLRGSLMASISNLAPLLLVIVVIELISSPWIRVKNKKEVNRLSGRQCNCE